MLSLAPRENPNYSWIARASVYVPRKWAVLDSFLAVLAPPVAVLEVVDLALGHEREPRLPGPLLALALALVGRPAVVFLSFDRSAGMIWRSVIVTAKGEVAKASLDEIYGSVGQFMANTERLLIRPIRSSANNNLKSFPGGCD